MSYIVTNTNSSKIPPKPSWGFWKKYLKYQSMSIGLKFDMLRMWLFGRPK